MVFVVVILFLINTNPQVLDQPNKLSLYIKWVHTETALDIIYMELLMQVRKQM